jgi:hypothetical protein
MAVGMNFPTSGRADDFLGRKGLATTPALPAPPVAAGLLLVAGLMAGDHRRLKTPAVGTGDFIRLAPAPRHAWAGRIAAILHGSRRSPVRSRAAS